MTGEQILDHTQFDSDDQTLAAGDRVQLVAASPLLRRTRLDAMKNPSPGKRRRSIPKGIINEMDDRILGTLLRTEESEIPERNLIFISWIVGLDRPLYYSDNTQDGTPEVTELWEIRENGRNLRKIFTET